jgi:hypothetical protein
VQHNPSLLEGRIEPYRLEYYGQRISGEVRDHAEGDKRAPARHKDPDLSLQMPEYMKLSNDG